MQNHITIVLFVGDGRRCQTKMAFAASFGDTGPQYAGLLEVRFSPLTGLPDGEASRRFVNYILTRERRLTGSNERKRFYWAGDCSFDCIVIVEIFDRRKKKCIFTLLHRREEIRAPDNNICSTI